MIRLERIKDGMIRVLNMTNNTIGVYLIQGGLIEGTVAISRHIIREFVRSGQQSLELKLD